MNTEFQVGNAGRDALRELTAEELGAVSGGAIMDMVIRVWENLTSDCLRRLTREGTVIDCSYPARL